MEASPLLERFLSQRKGVPPYGLEERMSGRDPFQVVLVCRLMVRGQAGILYGQRRQAPVRVPLVVLQDRRRLAGVEGVLQRWHWLEGERGVPGRFTKEAGNRFGDDPPLLGLCPAFNQHFQVEPL